MNVATAALTSAAVDNLLLECAEPLDDAVGLLAPGRNG